MSESDLELRIAGLEQLLCDGEERIKELERALADLIIALDRGSGATDALERARTALNSPKR